MAGPLVVVVQRWFLVVVLVAGMSHPILADSTTPSFQIAIRDVKFHTHEPIGTADSPDRYLVSVSFLQEYWNANNQTVLLEYNGIKQPDIEFVAQPHNSSLAVIPQFRVQDIHTALDYSPGLTRKEQWLGLERTNTDSNDSLPDGTYLLRPLPHCLLEDESLESCSDSYPLSLSYSLTVSNGSISHLPPVLPQQWGQITSLERSPLSGGWSIASLAILLILLRRRAQ